MTGFRYGVLGAGRQGTAAAYDLIVRGEAQSVAMADADGGQARAAAEKVNRLAGDPRATARRLDAADTTSVIEFLRPLDAFVSAVPYRLNLELSRAAIQARTHMCDLGGHTGIVFAQLELDGPAREAGICLIPDCGEAPGLSSNLLAHASGMLDTTEELLLLDGGLPLHPKPPWNYELTFNMDGLTNEYYGSTTFVRDGELVEVECFDPEEYELVDFGPPFGTLEAFVAAGGSTTPWTLGRGLRSLKNKVLRYPGHAAQFKAFRDLGLFEEPPVTVDGVEIVPRRVFHSLIEPKIRADERTRDVVIARVVATGRHAHSPAEAVVDVRVHYDEVLGLTAMEQSTGWHAAIVCWLMASGRIEPGARPVEVAVPPHDMLAEVRRRGFEVTESISNPGR